MHRRTAALFLLLALVAGACGGSTDSSQVNGGLLAALERTRAAESVRIEYDMTMNVMGMEIEVFGEGVSTADGRTGEMTIEGAGALASAFPRSTIRIVDGIQYFPAELAALSGYVGVPPSATWVAVPLPEFATSQQLYADFSSTFDLVEKSDGEITELPSGTLDDGTAVDRFAVSLRMGSVADQDELREALRDQYALTMPPGTDLDSLIENMVSAMQDLVYESEFAVDDAGVVRQMILDMDMSTVMQEAMADFGATEDLEMRMVMTMRFVEFGVPVDVTAPTEGVHRVAEDA